MPAAENASTASGDSNTSPRSSQNTTVDRNVGGTGGCGSSMYSGRALAVAAAYSRTLPRSTGIEAIAINP